MIPKIISGEKTIESRWYKTKCEAFGRVNAGDTVYFKNSGEPVSLKTGVVRGLEFSDLNQKKIKNILKKFGEDIGMSRSNPFSKVRNKKYCILVFLKNPQKIKPFNINKKGFGFARAWLSVKNIEAIRIN